MSGGCSCAPSACLVIGPADALLRFHACHHTIACTLSLPADLATLLVVFSLLVLDRVAYTLGSPLLKAVLHTG